jgi:hypothetical protein
MELKTAPLTGRRFPLFSKVEVLLKEIIKQVARITISEKKTAVKGRWQGAPIPLGFSGIVPSPLRLQGLTGLHHLWGYVKKLN